MATRTWVFDYDHPPERVWPALADTARFNEAAELPKHRIEEEAAADGSVVFVAYGRKGPFDLEWEEIPVEWVHGRWFRHCRRFRKGPIATLCATLCMRPTESGCRVEYTVDAEAANVLGSVILRTGFFPGIDKTFRPLFASAGDFAAGERELPYDVKGAGLTDGAAGRLAALARRLEENGDGHGLADRLAAFLQAAQETDLLHLRPLRLARLWGCKERDIIELCLAAVREGMLGLRWDLLCPRCRGAKMSAPSLDRLPTGVHCGACNIDYGRDFARNVELTFHPAPAIRSVDEGEFCLMGPMTTPHIKAQVTVAPGESREVDADLDFGDYRLRTLHPGGETEITWRSGGFPEVSADWRTVDAGPPAADGRLRLTNRADKAMTIIVESRDWAQDALTGLRVTTMQAFRDLFPGDVLRRDDEMGVERITLMFTDLKGSTALYERVGDTEAYHLVREHFAYLAATIREHDGAIVKTIGDAVMAAFARPEDAVAAGLAVQNNVAAFNAAHDGSDAIVIKLGLHAGPCIAVRLNERLDYFGSTVNLAARLQGESDGGDVVLSGALAAEPGVAPMLTPYRPRPENASLKGIEEPIAILRLTPEGLANPCCAAT